MGGVGYRSTVTAFDGWRPFINGLQSDTVQTRIKTAGEEERQ